MTTRTPTTTLRETIRIVRGRLPLLRYHLERLSEGGIPAEQLAAVETVVREAAREHAEAFKLQVVVRPGAGFGVHASREPSSLDVPGGPGLLPVFVHAPPPLPDNAAKPADRAYWDGPQRLAQLRGGHQALLTAEDGTVIDGGTATLWCVFDGVLVTPPAPPAVAGVARRVILRGLAPTLGVRVAVEPLTLFDVQAAEEVLLSNAVGGVVAARGRGGQVAERLCVAFAELLEEDGSVGA